MPDLVVKRVERVDDVNHGADFDDRDNMIYVWCYGPTPYPLWKKSDEGAPVTCLRCIVYGPREEWTRRNPFGQRGRAECIEGQRYLVFDTETGGRGY